MSSLEERINSLASKIKKRRDVKESNEAQAIMIKEKLKESYEPVKEKFEEQGLRFLLQDNDIDDNHNDLNLYIRVADVSELSVNYRCNLLDGTISYSPNYVIDINESTEEFLVIKHWHSMRDDRREETYVEHINGVVSSLEAKVG